MLEHDRKENRKGPDALAPPWWESFGFKLVDELCDTESSLVGALLESPLSSFGALFEFSLSGHQQNCPEKRPPQYVMAFRGTIITSFQVKYRNSSKSWNFWINFIMFN